jgi:hypothetical protein
MVCGRIVEIDSTTEPQEKAPPRTKRLGNWAQHAAPRQGFVICCGWELVVGEQSVWFAEGLQIDS